MLKSNPATYSAFRRFSPKLLYSAKIAEDNFIYIERQFSQISSDRYRILIYEDFLDRPEDYIEGLSQWWGLDEELLRENSKTKLIKPFAVSDIPIGYRETLEAFFTEKRVNQWRDFYHSNMIEKVGSGI